MKRKKFIFILGITVFTIFLVAIFFINNHGVKSQDEWKLRKKQYDEDFFVDKWSYIHGDGSFTKENWEKIDNKWYYFDFEGYAKVDIDRIGDNFYYFGKDGAMRTAWQRIKHQWYYFGTDGKGLRGEHVVDGQNINLTILEL